MFKKFAVAVAFSALTATTVAAQAIQPNLVSGRGACRLDAALFAPYTPMACFGFFRANDAVKGFATGQLVSSSNNTTAWDALRAFGFSANGPYSVIEKANWNGTSNFSTLLTGLTVIGIHWGNYPDDDVRNVSAFYMFDFGTPGTRDFNLSDTQGISNYSVIYTNGACRDQNCEPGLTTVPEPSTYALMGMGLLGIFGVARRRRNAA